METNEGIVNSQGALASIQIASADVMEANQCGLAVQSVTVQDMIPEDERAVETEVSAEYDGAKALGYFSPVYGMAHITAVLDDKFYAAIRVDAKGIRHVEFCQQYEDGRFSAKTSVPQADLLMAQMSLKTETAANKNSKDDTLSRTAKTKLSKVIAKVSEDYLGKFNGDTFYDVELILSALFSVLRNLPVHDERLQEYSPAQFYSELMRIIKSDKFGYAPAGEHKAYMAFDDTQIEQMAQAMGMTMSAFLKKLREYGFLYLTASSKGYQTKIRWTFENVSHTDWAYCIMKLDYIANSLKS